MKGDCEPVGSDELDDPKDVAETLWRVNTREEEEKVAPEATTRVPQASEATNRKIRTV